MANIRIYVTIKGSNTPYIKMTKGNGISEVGKKYWTTYHRSDQNPIRKKIYNIKKKGFIKAFDTEVTKTKS